MPLKAIAIDDEPMALEVIRELSAKVRFIELSACFTDALEAIAFLQSNKIDLIFLDIKMPDISGIDLLKSISNPPMVIFTTAYSEHAVQSFELDAIDYLLKPFSLSRFLKASNKAYEQFQLRNKAAQPQSLFVKTGYEQIRIDLDDILYIESSGNYVHFILTKQKITSRLTMAETEAMLPANDFIRIHRSFIIARNKINKIDKTSVWINQSEIPVGSAYVNEVGKINN